MRASYESLREFMYRRGHLSAVVLVAVATVAFMPFRAYLDSRHWGWPYLLIVGSVAGTAGMSAALFAAVLSFLVWNFFFIPPYHTLIVADPQDLVQLLVYLAVATAVGLQTGRLREREAAAKREERHADALARLAAGLVSRGTLGDIAALADAEIGSVLPGSVSVVWVQGASGTLRAAAGESPGPPGPVVASRDRDVAYGLPARPAGGSPDPWPESSGEDAGGSVVVPLHSARGTEGVLEIRLAEGTQLAAEEAAFVVSTAHLLAAFLEARSLAQVANSAVAAREAERLRTALISSVSHELKTPLAAVTASITDLLEPDVAFDEESVRARLREVTRDLRRLDGAIADLVDASRLEARAWAPNPAVYEPGEILGDVIARLRPAQRDRVRLDVPEGLPSVYVDFVQVSKALGHVVDNAMQYSSDSVEIGVRRGQDGMLECWVADRGPGIREAERERVFEKFFRGAAGRASKSSSGLGLAITRDLLEANRGSISIVPGSPGTRVLIELPTGERADGE